VEKNKGYKGCPRCGGKFFYETRYEDRREGVVSHSTASCQRCRVESELRSNVASRWALETISETLSPEQWTTNSDTRYLDWLILSGGFAAWSLSQREYFWIEASLDFENSAPYSLTAKGKTMNEAAEAVCAKFGWLYYRKQIEERCYISDTSV